MSDLHALSDVVRVSLRVPRATLDEWDAARGFESLSSWLRRAGDAFAGEVPERVQVVDLAGRVVADVPQARAAAEELATVKAAPRSRARTEMCEHRVPAGTWCKRCGS